jgi:hypothetical protein
MADYSKGLEERIEKLSDEKLLRMLGEKSSQFNEDALNR